MAFQARGLIRQSTVQLGKHRACLSKSYSLGYRQGFVEDDEGEEPRLERQFGT